MDSLYHQQPYPQPFYSPPITHHHYHPQDHHVFQPFYHQQHAAPPSMWPTMMSPPQTLPPPSALQPVMIPKPKLTTTVWEDQCTLCYQVDVNNVCVTRRQDNDMINGTKLLNVVGMSRGKRDGILKNEKGRLVVRVGAMHLKGVWITYQRAKDLALKYKIMDLVYPLFAEDPSEFLSSTNNSSSNSKNNNSSSSSCSSLTSAASETEATSSTATTPKSSNEYLPWQSSTMVPPPSTTTTTTAAASSHWDYLSAPQEHSFVEATQYDPWFTSDCTSYTASMQHDILSSSSKRKWDDDFEGDEDEDDVLDNPNKRFRTFIADDVYSY
ncbi:hypothetical protein LRAMOSA08831 [Lichtheimia ramosa]|uniref:HTH APSES-type domain-containing protein n=1 Tax=Lichtheimia ramosa TaxID=688394 RepID=A0A077WGY0_9FUNG|nr:hypothetical protein LRAMOSA08831 [Lichtheimia ramosa]